LAGFLAVERGGNAGGKIKGRPVAADENTGEADIFHTISGNDVGRLARANLIVSLFVRLDEYSSAFGFCQDRHAKLRFSTISCQSKAIQIAILCNYRKKYQS
jgi:hypothetical protein